MKAVLILLSLILILGCTSKKVYHHEWKVMVEYFNGDVDTLAIEHKVQTHGGCGLILQTSKHYTFGASEIPSCLVVYDGFYRITQACNVRRFKEIEHTVIESNEK